MTLSGFPVVLLVDDDRADQKLAKHALAALRKDITLYVAGSAEEAIAYLTGCKDKGTENLIPHLILLDLNMPGMGGKAFLKYMKTSDEPCRIPVFVLTTSDSETDKQECHELGATGYLQKPASAGDFKEVVTKAAEYWSGISSPADGTLPGGGG